MQLPNEATGITVRTNYESSTRFNSFLEDFQISEEYDKLVARLQKTWLAPVTTMESAKA